MKSTQKVKRVKLNLEQNNEYALIGLVSAEPDYKLCLSINKKFRISLKNDDPFTINDQNHPELSFSRFSDHHDPAVNIFSLISNRNGKYFLLNKLKNIDYLLQIRISENETNLPFITSFLREIDSVTGVFNIDYSALKDKNLHYLIQ